MTKSELHQMIADSKDNESNICQIYAIKNGVTVYDDCWHEYKTTDAVNVMSVTKSVNTLIGYIRKHAAPDQAFGLEQISSKKRSASIENTDLRSALRRFVQDDTMRIL